MASLAPGTTVVLLDDDRRPLAFPPPADAELAIAVHSGALSVGLRNRLTQVVGFLQQRLVWAGAIDETMLQLSGAPPVPAAREALTRCLGLGDSCWSVIEPGFLIRDASRRPCKTVYDGHRPWVVVGELATGDVLAMPLNDARGNPKWYAPVIPARDLRLPGGKDAQLELAHCWSFPRAAVRPLAHVSDSARYDLELALANYFR